MRYKIMSLWTKIPLVLLATAIAVALCSRVAPADEPSTPTPTTIRVTANHIAFYNDRFLVEADGNVRVTTSEGLTIRGEAFSMDLKLNRFVVAGRVHVSGTKGAQSGAALSDYLDFHRVYFLPVLSKPDRWTFIGGDFSKPYPGRQMPGDVFYLPDLHESSATVFSRSATIVSGSFVRFNLASVSLGGIYLPLPAYYVNFAADPNLAVNSLSGANFDGTLNIAGNANSVTGFHTRYDTVNKLYFSLEQHFASKRAHAVISVNPATRPSKYWNGVFGWSVSNKALFSSYVQLHTVQRGLSMPSEAQFTSISQLTQAFAHSSLSATYQTTNYSLLPQSGCPAYGSGLFSINCNNTSALTLSAASIYQKIWRTPLFMQTFYSIGMNHNAYGLQTFGGAIYQTIWNHNVGATVYLPQLVVGNKQNSFRSYYFNASATKQRTWYSLPHYVDNTDTRLSLSRNFSNALNAYLSYEVLNTGDYYTQGPGYTGYTPIVNGISYPGFAAFRGVTTQRTVSLGMNYTPTPDFALVLLARDHDDFPKPVPGLFNLPITNVLGQSVSSVFLGQPQFDITGDVRMRLSRHLVLDVQRTYFSSSSFANFGQLNFSPQFVISVTQ